MKNYVLVAQFTCPKILKMLPLYTTIMDTCMNYSNISLIFDICASLDVVDNVDMIHTHMEYKSCYNQGLPWFLDGELIQK